MKRHIRIHNKMKSLDLLSNKDNINSYISNIKSSFVKMQKLPASMIKFLTNPMEVNVHNNKIQPLITERGITFETPKHARKNVIEFWKRKLEIK